MKDYLEPLPKRVYDKMREKGVDLHPEFGSWMGNLLAELEPEQMEENGKYCVVLHHWDSVQLVLNARLGPVVHPDERRRAKLTEEGCQGIYYAPHPVSAIIRVAGRDE